MPWFAACWLGPLMCAAGSPPLLSQFLSRSSSPACARCRVEGGTENLKVVSCDPCDDRGLGRRPWGPGKVFWPSGSSEQILSQRLVDKGCLVQGIAPPPDLPPSVQTSGVPHEMSSSPASSAQVVSSFAS